MTKKLKAQILLILEQTYPDVKSALVYTNPFELLIAVILSAQCTDTRVNKTTKSLFAKADTPKEIQALGIDGLEAEIKNCGLFHNKAKNIMSTSKILCEEYQGCVPNDFKALLSLPGVGRKTANVVISQAFGQPAIAVDTHVFRVANRLHLAQGQTPLEVEKGLKAAIPEEKWSQAHHWLIWHGRRVCKSRNPQCNNCPLHDICPSHDKC